jgi:hypothetical protein
MQPPRLPARRPQRIKINAIPRQPDHIQCRPINQVVQIHLQHTIIIVRHHPPQRITHLNRLPPKHRRQLPDIPCVERGEQAFAEVFVPVAVDAAEQRGGPEPHVEDFPDGGLFGEGGRVGEEHGIAAEGRGDEEARGVEAALEKN